MDEYNQGWDPDVRQYFKKIMNSFVVGATWLLFVSTLGLFMKLGYIRGNWQWYNIVFYSLVLISFFFLLLFLYRLWRKRE